ncbi:MAG: radical SAM protein [Parcubacteria group bacterium]
MKKKTPLFLPIIRRIQESGRVQHTTINLTGPGGVARLHLTPSKFSLRPLPSMLVINGMYRLPLSSGPAAMVRAFINTMDRYGKAEVSETMLEKIIEETIKTARHLYPDLSIRQARAEFDAMMNVIIRLARNEPIAVSEVGYTMEEWAKIAQGPERMDIMVMPVKRNGRRVCNLDCGVCYAAELETAELSTGQWRRIIQRLKSCGVSQITFTGGEPTVREDLVELVAAAKWYVTRLNTNGTLLTLELCRALYEAELDAVQITLYSHNTTVHETLVGKRGAWQKTIQGIKNAVAAGLNVSVNVPLVCDNADGFTKTLKFIRTLGVLYVTCSGVIRTGGGAELSEGEALTRNELLRVLTSATEQAASLGIEIQFTNPGQLTAEQLAFLGLPEPMCGACLSNMSIRPDGQVVPCQSWIAKPLGHILRTPWSWIWKGSVCRGIREKFALHNYCPLSGEEV